MLGHQSDREFERAYFPSGIAGDAKKNGHEERCVILLFLIIFCNTHGNNVIEKAMGPNRTSLLVLVMSHLLLLEQFLRSDFVYRRHVNLLKEYMHIFISFYKHAIQRKKGKGSQIIKIHHPMHTPFDILRLGPATVFDSSYGESHHQKFKEFGRKTQKNAKSFEPQVAKQDEEERMLGHAERELFISDTKQSSNQSGTFVRGHNYSWNQLGFCVMPKKRTSLGPRTVAKWVNKYLQSNFNSFIRKYLPMSVACRPIPFYNQVRVDNNLYRADP